MVVVLEKKEKEHQLRDIHQLMSQNQKDQNQKK